MEHTSVHWRRIPDIIMRRRFMAGEFLFFVCWNNFFVFPLTSYVQVSCILNVSNYTQNLQLSQDFDLVIKVTHSPSLAGCLCCEQCFITHISGSPEIRYLAVGMFSFCAHVSQFLLIPLLYIFYLLINDLSNIST